MRKNVFLMYFWTLNSNMFLEFLYHPHLLHCIRPRDRTRLCMRQWGPVGGSLDMSTVTCHTRVTNSPLQVAGQSSVCYHL